MIDPHELIAFIKQTVADSPANRLGCPGAEGQPIWEQILVGFADGDDELFAFFKEDIGPFYWLPAEAFVLKYPGTEIGHLTVLSLALAHAAKTRREQRACIREPSTRWRYSRKHWPEFMADLANKLTGHFADLGIRAVTPELLPEWSWQRSEKYGHASNWSQRHTAYAAGLGTFGLSDGLITAQGKANRFLSIILEKDLPATPRTYSTPYEWCLYFQDQSCGRCISRCPAGAITPSGHDKAACAAYVHSMGPKYAFEGPGTSGCGLCQTGVPCESRRPVI